MAQTFDGGDGSNVLSVNRDGQAATDTGTAVEVDGAAPMANTGATGAIENVPLANGAPTPAGDALVLDEDAPATFNLLDANLGGAMRGGGPDVDPDGDALEVTAVTQPASGTVELLPLGYVVYTPDEDATGSASFIYTVSDGRGGTGEATAMVTVAPVNDAPEPASVTAPGEGVEVVFDGDPATPLTVTWDAATDVDGDDVTYQWRVYADAELTERTYAGEVVEGTTYTTTLGAVGEGVATLNEGESRTYYHLVATSDGEAVTLGPAVAVTFSGGSIVPIEATPPVAFAVHGASPNPAAGRVAVRLDVPSASTVRLTLYDALGREVGAAETSVPAGRDQEIALPVASLPAGLYVYRLAASGPEGESVATGRVVVVR